MTPVGDVFRCPLRWKLGVTGVLFREGRRIVCGFDDSGKPVFGGTRGLMASPLPSDLQDALTNASIVTWRNERDQDVSGKSTAIEAVQPTALHPLLPPVEQRAGGSHGPHCFRSQVSTLFRFDRGGSQGVATTIRACPTVPRSIRGKHGERLEPGAGVEPATY